MGRLVQLKTIVVTSNEVAVSNIYRNMILFIGGFDDIPTCFTQSANANKNANAKRGKKSSPQAVCSSERNESWWGGTPSRPGPWPAATCSVTTCASAATASGEWRKPTASRRISCCPRGGGAPSLLVETDPGFHAFVLLSEIWNVLMFSATLRMTQNGKKCKFKL